MVLASQQQIRIILAGIGIWSINKTHHTAGILRSYPDLQGLVEGVIVGEEIILPGLRSDERVILSEYSLVKVFEEMLMLVLLLNAAINRELYSEEIHSFI